MSILDHVGIVVGDYATSLAFYQKALAPLGITIAKELPAEIIGVHGAGFGVDGKPDFWITEGKKMAQPIHIAFAAASRDLVDAFYAAAMAAGGTDNGPPGIRAHYHPDYYGAFVRDPEGHNVEAVCHRPA